MADGIAELDDCYMTYGGVRPARRYGYGRAYAQPTGFYCTDWVREDGWEAESECECGSCCWTDFAGDDEGWAYCAGGCDGSCNTASWEEWCTCYTDSVQEDYFETASCSCRACRAGRRHHEPFDAFCACDDFRGKGFVRDSAFVDDSAYYVSKHQHQHHRRRQHRREGCWLDAAGDWARRCRRRRGSRSRSRSRSRGREVQDRSTSRCEVTLATGDGPERRLSVERRRDRSSERRREEMQRQRSRGGLRRRHVEEDDEWRKHRHVHFDVS